MILDLKRTDLTEQTTIGELFVDGAFECFVLEDRYRPPPEQKVPGKTAIPNGRYEVVVNMSPRFKRELPLLMAVPGFTGVRIHTGNDAGDTEGCLLPGRVKQKDRVLESTLAFDQLFAKIRGAIARGERVWLNVTLARK